jgi:dipeptidyl aminopeptidase/acylaminoacyl peptidase
LYLSIGDSGGHGELRKIDISSRQLTERTVLLNDEPREISIGRHLVYSRRSADMNIWRATIPPPGSAPTEPELFITSTRTDIKPEYSPDGKKIAFNSDRSGSREIWIANADGSNQVQVTFFGGPLVGVTTWSPDGQWLLFHARPEGQADLFVIPAAGGSPRRLTTHSADDTLSSYSRDGRWIYFSSARSGTIQIWKMPAEGGEPVKITTRRGSAPFESFDGKTIFYRPQDLSEIWGIPSNGGQAVKVTGPIQRYPVGYAVTADGIYYPAPPHSGEQGFIMFFSFATGRSIPIVVASQRLGLGMSVSPDGHYILFDQADESNSDLMLVQNFQVR